MTTRNGKMLPSFSHEEHITVASASPKHVVIRLEAVTALKSIPESQKKKTTTPFPNVVLSEIVQEFGISRLLVQSASSSSSSSTIDLGNDVLQDDYVTGPSGVSVFVEWRNDSNNNNNKRLDELLNALVGYRFFLAPLDAFKQARLHRHVYTTTTESAFLPNNRLQLEVVLPLDGSAVALEGVHAFVSSPAAVCPNHGVFSNKHARTLSQVLLGDSNNIQVSQQIRRSMWMDIQSTCHNHDPAAAAAHDNAAATATTCDVTIKRGMQYGVVLPLHQQDHDTNKVKLSTLVPLSSLQECPIASQTTQLSTRVHSAATESIVQQTDPAIVDDWNMDTVVDVSTEPKRTVQLYGNRILLRPRGVASSGTIVTRIESSLQCPVTVRVVEIVPSFIRPLWDTWTLITTTTATHPHLSVQADGSIQVEWNATLLPETSLQVTLDYEPVFLPFQQFPADPNRGIELPPTRFVFDCSNCTADSAPVALDGSFTTSIKLYSSPLLLMPPVPDMSMPFNVISLTSTLYAFVVGSLANLLVRKASQRIKKKLHPKETKSKLQKLKEHLKSKLAFLQRISASNQDSPSANSSNGDDKAAKM